MGRKIYPSHRRQVRANQELMRGAKDVPCADCGDRHPHYIMDFDHRDPTTKSFAIGGNQTRSRMTMMAEIEKCDVVCANCHRERTHGTQGGDAVPVVSKAFLSVATLALAA